MNAKFPHPSPPVQTGMTAVRKVRIFSEGRTDEYRDNRWVRMSGTDKPLQDQVNDWVVATSSKIISVDFNVSTNPNSTPTWRQTMLTLVVVYMSSDDWLNEEVAVRLAAEKMNEPPPKLPPLSAIHPTPQVERPSLETDFFDYLRP